MQGALFGNVGSLITFAVGARDAEELSRQFDHHLKPEELTGLRQFEIALKLPKRDGLPAFPFKAYTLAAGLFSSAPWVGRRRGDSGG